MAGSTSAGISLAGRLALVTGGGSGIGRAVCKALSQEGARIVAADKNKQGAATTIQDLPGAHEHHALEVDVGSSDSVQTLFGDIKKLYSVPVSVVVNCAGITRDSFLLDMTEEAFDSVNTINLKGTYLVTQAAAREMVSQNVQEGSIVNLSSIIGKTGNMGQSNYAASKAGVVGFTKTVALELARHNIRCNAVMPGFIDTPMVAQVPERVMAKLLPCIPLGRKGTPEEVAEAVLFLCSPRSSYVTGSVLEVTGGMFM
ncbi:estradiol 17-beta-dehydrogenase 8-like [Ixodes scapularis]|uniref:estradiol 17-beta-dehydrogenase 8-like n=1 Tax=Ixodes scapularis TaxID=6945 RepID=UPI001C394A9D|nr:estradiol 17-beta-dehydrogenase 8-like [Ixodes scapularis]